MPAPALTRYVQGQGSVSADNLNTFVQSCDTISQLRSFIGVPGIQVYVRGFTVPGDGGQGDFWWDANGTGPDNGIDVVVPTGTASGAWVRLNLSPYDIAINFPGVLANSQTFRYTATRDLTFAPNFGLIAGGISQSSADVAAAAQAVLTILQAPPTSPNSFTQIGTITYSILSFVGIFASINGSAYRLPRGGVLHVVGPATADTDLAGLSISMAASRL